MMSGGLPDEKQHMHVKMNTSYRWSYQLKPNGSCSVNWNCTSIIEMNKEKMQGPEVGEGVHTVY